MTNLHVSNGQHGGCNDGDFVGEPEGIVDGIDEAGAMLGEDVDGTRVGSLDKGERVGSLDEGEYVG